MGNEYDNKNGINVLALVKNHERYIFLYDDDDRGEALRTLGRFACDPDLSFSWYDAAVLSQRIKKESKTRENKPREEKLTEAIKKRFTLPAPGDNLDTGDFL